MPTVGRRGTGKARRPPSQDTMGGLDVSRNGKIFEGGENSDPGSTGGGDGVDDERVKPTKERY